ncbi:putative penicillin-binding protein PbpX [Pelotomaculum sp. FP]|uniref:serine hydrolase domain-containing protein n=1 Tax=Pelotomaculum sp. FP TaxID=261474 RepID=UPI0010648C84|nr:serine hydrolase domain-containing protein [Pelotomaculum sp. FP]TEB16150.1 putative penicillin-binding protein PbpX [Pelotomaculum sp. FP]
MSRPLYHWQQQANPAEPFWPEQAGPPQEVSLKPYPNVPQNILDTAILEEMHKSQIVGVSAAFVKDSGVVWANGYGWADLEKSRPAGPDTIYRIASISKTITATALMQLWESGLFRLDSDISSCLGYPVRNPHYPDDKITFHMLLTHTSSILDTGGYAAALSSPNPPPLRELLVPGSEAYSSLTWGDYRPGARFNYSNFGAGIIGALVEMLSGERFDRYAINHIFKPLGMDASYVPADIVNHQKIAVLYETSGDGRFSPACDYYPEGQRPSRRTYQHPLGNFYIGPAGAVRTSVLDLAKFTIAHMNGGVYGDVRILSSAAVDLMHQIHWCGFGLAGFFRQMGLMFHITDALAGRRLTGHAGDACGLVSDMYFDRDENNGVIFVTNGGCYEFLKSGYKNIEESVINRIYAQFAGPPGPAP